MKLAYFVDQVFGQDATHIFTDESYILFVASLADHGDELVLIGREAPAPRSGPFKIKRDQVSLLGLQYYPSVPTLWRRPSAVFHLKRLLDQHWKSWDALLVCGPHPLGNALARAALKRGLPVVFVVRQNLIDQQWAHGGIKGLVFAGAAAVLEYDFRRLARGRPVLAVGMEAADAYTRTKARALSHFPCLIDEAQYADFSRIFPQFGSRRLIVVARLAPEKGHRFLFAALRQLADEGIECHADIVGSGPLENELKNLSLAMGLGDLVTFHGYVPYGDKLFGLYRGAAALVLPSLTEGFPQVINEALCIGLPVVASRVGGIPAFVQHGETGLLTRPRDIRDLKSAVANILENQDLWRSLSRNGRAAMAGNTLEANRDRILKVLHNEVERTV